MDFRIFVILVCAIHAHLIHEDGKGMNDDNHVDIVLGIVSVRQLYIDRSILDKLTVELLIHKKVLLSNDPLYRYW